MCQKEMIEHAEEKVCQRILGAGPDAAIAELLLAQLTPLAIDTTMQVYEELHAQAAEARRLREQQVERARSPADHHGPSEPRASQHARADCAHRSAPGRLHGCRGGRAAQPAGVAHLRRETLFCCTCAVLTTLSAVESSWHQAR